jgi:hypothetical protein
VDEAAIASDRWLVFDSREGVGTALAARLEMKGHRALLVPADTDPGIRRVAVRDFLSSPEAGRRGIVYLSGLDIDGRQDAPDFETARGHGWGGVLDVLHAVAESKGAESKGAESKGAESNGAESNGAESNGAELNGATANHANGEGFKVNGAGGNGAAANGASTNGASTNGASANGTAANGAMVHEARANPAEPPRLWLVTRGAQATGDHPLSISLTQSPIWGMARVIAAELPALACTRIDLDPENYQEAADQLAEELGWGQSEDQVVYRGGIRHVARLRHWKQGAAGALHIPEGQPYRLEITTRGQLDHVALRPVTRGRPGPRGRNPRAGDGPELPRRAECAGLVPRRSRSAGGRVRG